MHSLIERMLANQKIDILLVNETKLTSGSEALL